MKKGFKTTPVSRITLFCRDLEKSLALYRDILGFEEVENKTIQTKAFNELMNMLNGDLAITRYIGQNVKRSGLEIWRKLHRNNDPNTYNTKDSYRGMIEQIAANRTKNTKEII